MKSASPKKKQKSPKDGNGEKEMKNRKRKSPEGIEAFLTDDSSMKKKVSKKDKENGKPQKVSKAEKGMKKPLNVIGAAAKKLKKFKSKDDKIDGDQKATKRKHEGDESAQKLVSMKFKDRKKVRKTFRTNYDLSLKCKSLWEQLRKVDITKEKRIEVANELYDLVKGRCTELICAHDTSRVIQCLVKYGTPAHRDAVFEELKGEVLHMTKNKYAKFIVRKMLKYGKKEHKKEVFNGLYGNVQKLIKHQEAADIIELAYNYFANAQQRSALVTEFYGPIFALFKTNESWTLDDIMKAQPEKRESILKNMKETISTLIDKSICQYSIVHRVILEYFTFADEKQRSEMIEVVRESIVHMLHTRDGSRVAMQCVWNGTAKDRKIIVKSLKTFVTKICKEEYGHLVLLAIFDVVDDTKIVHKVILEEMLKNLEEVALDQYGRKVLFYLLTPRNSKHFCPDIVSVLKQGDENKTSKKETSVRQSELLAPISAPLQKFAKEKVADLWTENASMLLITSIINHTQGDPNAAMKAVACLAARHFKGGADEEKHIVAHPFGHVALKRMLMHDKERPESSTHLAQIIVETVDAENLTAWTSCNRGCFILASLFDVGDPLVTAMLEKALGPVKTSLKKKPFKGAEILLSKLK